MVMKLLIGLLIIMLVILIIVEMNKWALCSTYMKTHLDGLVGR